MRKILPGGFLAWVVVVIALSGCRQPDQVPATPGSQQTERPAVDPGELWRRVAQAYASAQHYHDNGKLVLRYRLNDRPMEEHQLWAVAFDRSGKLAARVFNARVHSDWQRTILRVFDWNSQNMDNQIVVQPPFNPELWSQLLADPVARHFLTGGNEIPFAAGLDPQRLVPLAARLLQASSQAGQLIPEGPSEYVGREELDGTAVEVVARGTGAERIAWWIDPATCCIRQIELPLSLLEPQLLSSPEISGLRLVARLEGAQFAPPAEATIFSTDLPPDCHPVQAFVPLPERFPSAAIGKPLPNLTVYTPDGSAQVLTAAAAAGKLLFWLDGSQASHEAQQQLATFAGPERQTIFLDYRPDVDGQSPEPVARLRALLAGPIKLPQPLDWFDIDNAAGRLVDIQFAPAAVLVDSQGVVQFVQPLLEPTWPTRLQTAVRRVAAGDDLAGEIRGEYEAFLDQYRQRLLAANPLAPPQPSAATLDPAPSATALPQVEPLWECVDVKQPGNMVWDRSRQQLYVLDGWQSIAALELASRRVQRFPLAVDSGVALARLRTVPSDPPQFAAFAALGSTVYLFGSDWKVAHQADISPQRILDVQLYSSVPMYTRAPARPAELLVVDNDHHVRHLRASGADASQLETVGTAAAELGASLAAIPPGATWPTDTWYGFLLRGDGACAALGDAGQVLAEFRLPELRLTRICLATGPRLAALGTALDRNGNWIAVGIDRNFQIAWSHPIGSQAFDQQIDPIDHRLLAGRETWVIAGSDATLTILDDQGGPPQRWSCAQPIRGVCWIDSSPPATAENAELAAPNLAVALDSKIQLIRLPLPPPGK